MNYASFQEQFPNNTTGAGTATAGSPRLLNTVVVNTISGSSLDATTGLVTLPAGTYKASGYAVNSGVNVIYKCQIGVYDFTNSVHLVNGASVVSPAVGQPISGVNTSLVEGYFTLSSTTEVGIVSNLVSAESTPANSGAVEVYTQLNIESL